MNSLMKLAMDSAEPTFNLSIILATVWVIKNDFAVYTTSALTIGQYAIKLPSRRYQNDLIDEVLKMSQNPLGDIKFLVEGEMKPKDMSEETMTKEELQERFFQRYANREKSIWFLDSLQGYLKFEKDLLDSKRHYHRHGFFLIVYTGMEAERLSNIKEIFRRLFSLYVLNVNVMIMIGKYPYLYTYFPFAPNKCHSSQPEFYISFRGIEKNSNFTLDKRLFPSKVNNMYGCVLTVITWTYPPYVYVDKDEKTGKLITLHGIEGLLITLLSQLMNFTIEIREPVPKDRGDVYTNGSATGAAKMILERQANLTIVSYMYNKERSTIMQASDSYLTLPYILAIPQGKKMTPFERLIKPFRYIIWSCFSSSLLFAIIFIYYLRYLGRSKLMNFVYGHSNRIPFTNLLITMFGGSVHSNIPYRNFARFLLTVWLLYTLVLRTAYSGELFIILQDGSSRNNLKTFQELVNLNYTIFGFPAVEKVVKLTVPEAYTQSIDGTNTVASVFERISEPNTKERVALCLLDYSIRYYNQMHPMRRVETLPQSLITSPIVFYMPRHSYLRFRTSDLILRTLQSGLMHRYETFYLYSSRNAQSNQGEPKKLSFKLLLGLFCSYGVFLLICLLILVLEMCSRKSYWLRQFVDFINF